MNTVHFQSKAQDWSTPQAFYDTLDAEFGFTIDVCADESNAKHRRFFTESDDALRQSWAGEVAYMNPPYGYGIGKWVKKAHDEAHESGATVIALLPARTDTAWFHDYVLNAEEVRFVRGRLRFGGGSKENPLSHNAPFPCMVVVFRRHRRYPQFSGVDR